MNNPITTSLFSTNPAKMILKMIWLACLLCSAAAVVLANPEISTSEDDKTVTVHDAPDQEVYVFGKSVIVKKRAKGVLAIGGDIYVEGDVDDYVATIGGNVIQKEGGSVGGDVIVIGGSYKPESQNPARGAGKQTIVIAVFEEQFRDLAQNPSQLIAPSITWAFVAQRLLVALFWFIISIIMTTVAPGAVGRAVARLNLFPLKILAYGSLAFVLTMVAIVGSATVLPDYLSITVSLMGIALLFFGSVFGRVALQVSYGKKIQKHFLSEKNRSETLSTLLGVLFWTLLLSIPYLWLIALFVVFAAGIGLILTARSPAGWKNT